MIVLRKNVKAIINLSSLLYQGQVIAAPTETAYGLMADATNRRALAQVVKIKGREPGKPIALVAADEKMVRRYFQMTNTEKRLAKKFWPGPLTLLLRPKQSLPVSVTSPRGLVGVRVPGDSWLRQLITAVNKPLTATSANRAGGPTPYTPAAVKTALARRGLKYLVDAGRLKPRLVSTVIRLAGNEILIIRPGAISESKLRLVYRLRAIVHSTGRRQS